MAEPRPYEQAIKIAGVQAEYRYVALTPCSNCGNRLIVGKQTLLTDARTGKKYDLLETACAQCKSAHEFLFDINSFFDKRESME